MPTTNSPKGTAIPVRPTAAMRQQLDELVAAGFGNQTDVIRTAIDRMYVQEKRHMNSGLTNNAWVKRVEEIRQMVASVPVATLLASDVEYYINEEFGLVYDDEKTFARQEFARQYGVKAA